VYVLDERGSPVAERKYTLPAGTRLDVGIIWASSLPRCHRRSGAAGADLRSGNLGGAAGRAGDRGRVAAGGRGEG